MRRTFSLSILLCCILLSACTAAPPQPTAAPIPTNTVPPTSMPTKTALLTPTTTLEPSSTPTPPPTNTNRTPSYPSEVYNDGRFEDVQCPGKTTFDMTVCDARRAYQSARDLDTLLLELDQHFPNGSWEEAFWRILLPQEDWENYKVPYCRFDNQLSIGGTAHGLWILDCIEKQNLDRIETLEYWICSRTRGFPRCTPGKPGGEEPFLTAIPQNPISEAEGDYLIYKINKKLTFYDPAKDLHVPILPDWEVNTYSISSNNVLAFSSEHDGDLDIYLLDYPFTENEPRNITDDLDTDDWVQDWSPDGQLLAFQSITSDNQKMLSIWDSNSISQIYRYKEHVGEYAWSKDGRLAFTEFYGFAGEVQPAEIFLWDGETVYSISQNPSGEDGNPAWSEDGQLAFNSVQEGKYNIFVWDGVTTKNGLPDKNTFQNIAPEMMPSYYSDPVWTSSGTISFSGSEGHYPQIYEWDGQTVTEISNNPNFPNVGQSWRKNGFWAFTTSYYSSEHKLYIRDEQNQTILETQGLFPPAWSDEGYLLYCIHDRTDDSLAWTLAIWDGENIHNVIEDSAYIWASWPNGENVYCSIA